MAMPCSMASIPSRPEGRAALAVSLRAAPFPLPAMFGTKAHPEMVQVATTRPEAA